MLRLIALSIIPLLVHKLTSTFIHRTLLLYTSTFASWIKIVDHRFTVSGQGSWVDLKYTKSEGKCFKYCRIYEWISWETRVTPKNWLELLDEVYRHFFFAIFPISSTPDIRRIQLLYTRPTIVVNVNKKYILFT